MRRMPLTGNPTFVRLPPLALHDRFDAVNCCFHVIVKWIESETGNGN